MESGGTLEIASSVTEEMVITDNTEDRGNFDPWMLVENKSRQKFRDTNKLGNEIETLKKVQDFG